MPSTVHTPFKSFVSTAFTNSNSTALSPLIRLTGFTSLTFPSESFTSIVTGSSLSSLTSAISRATYVSVIAQNWLVLCM